MAGRLIPVVADIPSERPRLGFPEYAAALAGAVRGGQPAQFSIGLYGDWGTGKTSLLQALKTELGEDDDVVAVLFDAWRYENTGSIVVPLLHEIYREVKARGELSAAERLGKALKALVFSLNFNLLGFGVDTKTMLAHWEDDFTALDEAFSRPFAELRALPEALNGKRIAVLIDDLDRCSPEKIVGTLEAINLVMDVPGFIFVLALDYNVLVDAIGQRYPHVSGHEFIEKIVQIPFRVPPLVADAPNFISELIPQWGVIVESLPHGADHLVADIARGALESNPRQIKRLVNTLLVTQEVGRRRGIEVDFPILAAVVGVQLGWPVAFEELRESVLSGAVQFVTTLDDQSLTDYLQTFLGGKDVNAIARVVLLTGEVVAEEELRPIRRAQPTVEERRDAELQRFLQAIWERGFRQSSRSPRLFYRADLSGVRVVVVKTVVRLETQTGGGWRLRSSFLITRQLPDALAMIDAWLASQQA